MKNREKFRDEIVEAIKEDNADTEKLCCFVQKNIIPRFVPKEYMEGSACGGMSCQTCAKMFTLWLDEEYEEPEVDWSKVRVDTLVRVRDDEEDVWALRYFCAWDEYWDFGRYGTFPHGTTSKTTTCNYIEHWKYCELVEEEEDEE